MKICTLFLLLTLPAALLLSGCSTMPFRSGSGHGPVQAAVESEGPGPAVTQDGQSADAAGDKSPLPVRKPFLGGTRATTVPGTGGSQFSVWRSVGAIIFVLAGLLAVNGFIRKRQGIGIGTGKAKNIRLVERLAIDPRRSILLVEVDGQRVLLGTAGDGIESLAVLGEAQGGEMNRE